MHTFGRSQERQKTKFFPKNRIFSLPYLGQPLEEIPFYDVRNFIRQKQSRSLLIGDAERREMLSQEIGHLPITSGLGNNFNLAVAVMMKVQGDIVIAYKGRSEGIFAPAVKRGLA